MSAARARIAVVGISANSNCGVRDHAGRLADALAGYQVDSSFHWLTRTPAALSGTRAEITRWAAELETQLRAERPQAILVHYSVFNYSYKGVPLFVRPIFRALRASGVPVIVFLHEFAYPWMYGGWRGGVWAVSQRLAMREIMRSSAAAIVTVKTRERWLQTRPWLARRPLRTAPVFSTLPPPEAGAAQAPQALLGLFGYSYQGAAMDLTLQALAVLAVRWPQVELRLLGAPGADSPSGLQWQTAARERGVGERLSFSGALPAQDLSNALAACTVLLFIDTAGPASRKTTLAAALASGRPLVAIDGAMTWRALVDEGALELAVPTATGLAEAVGGLLAGEPAREVLGARGREFYEREMRLQRSVEAVLELLSQLNRGA